MEYAKKLLFEKVNNVIISNRLTNEPCVVVADSYGHSAFMDKIQKAQMFTTNSEDNPLSDFKKILEINPHHRVNQIILEKINVSSQLRRTSRPTKNSRNWSSCSSKPLPSTPASLPGTPTSSSRGSTRSTPRPWASSVSSARK